MEEEIGYIREEDYRKVKEILNKKKDYFTREELKNYAKITLK